MKKICLVNNLYPPNSVGGAETVVFKIAKKHKNKGRKVFIITLNCDDNNKTTKIEEDGISVYRIPKFNIFGYKELSSKNFLHKFVWHFLDKFSFWGKKEIERIFIETNPDTVHTHNLTGLGFFIPKLIDSLKIEHIHTLHDVQLVEPSGILKWNHKKDLIHQKIYSFFVKKKIGSPNFVFYPSEFIKNFYKSRGFFEESLWRKTNNEFRKTSNLKKKVKNNKFLFVGTLNKNKGVQVLLDAWRMISKEKKVELHIVGDGPMVKDNFKLKKEDKRVFVYGKLGKEDLNKMYKKCDTLVFCSVCLENKPNVILEALENNLSVIASNTGGVGELLNRKTGKMYKPGDARSLANLILNI
ncbi:MAG: glycosyltransferase [Candidatus Magasanikbacteria bacterium]|nr:glycosyltransferase [Candidatus Magasanikbacteria bacterium]